MSRSEAAPSLTLIQADEARRILADTPPVGRERVPIGGALGRVLAAAFAAPADLPGERRSVMDGYAVRGADVRGASELWPVVLSVVGAVPMGDVFPRGVGPDEAVAIATGGWLPAGADTVVMVEHEMGTVERLCNPVIVMAQGRVLAEGSMAEMRANPAVVAAYLSGQRLVVSG